jgi:hypothetical protein
MCSISSLTLMIILNMALEYYITCDLYRSASIFGADSD